MMLDTVVQLVSYPAGNGVLFVPAGIVEGEANLDVLGEGYV